MQRRQLDQQHPCPRQQGTGLNYWGVRHSECLATLGVQLEKPRSLQQDLLTGRRKEIGKEADKYIKRH